MTVTGQGDKGLNLVGIATPADGLAGVFIAGQGDEGVTILSNGSGAHDLYLLGDTLHVGQLQLDVDTTAAVGVPRLSQLSPKYTTTSGALATQQFVSGAAAQVSTTGDVEVHTPVTFNSLVATIATCTVDLSPDNTTFSTLCVWTEPVGVALAGTIHDVTCRVPAGWYLKLTVAQAVLGLSTYY